MIIPTPLKDLTIKIEKSKITIEITTEMIEITTEMIEIITEMIEVMKKIIKEKIMNTTLKELLSVKVFWN